MKVVKSLLFCCFLFSIHHATSQIILLGEDADNLNTSIQQLKKSWSKKKSYKVAKFEIIERLLDSSNVNSKKYLDVDIILYRTPYLNANHKFFFNEEGYADSLIFTENACFDCSFDEFGDTIRFSYSQWKKTGDNQFASLYPFPVKRDKKNKIITCAYATLIRIPKPDDGTCRKWIMKLSNQQSYVDYLTEIKNKKKDKKEKK
jgi:hypothetical protein